MSVGSREGGKFCSAKWKPRTDSECGCLPERPDPLFDESTVARACDQALSDDAWRSRVVQWRLAGAWRPRGRLPSQIPFATFTPTCTTVLGRSSTPWPPPCCTCSRRTPGVQSSPTACGSCAIAGGSWNKCTSTTAAWRTRRAGLRRAAANPPPPPLFALPPLPACLLAGLPQPCLHLLVLITCRAPHCRRWPAGGVPSPRLKSAQRDACLLGGTRGRGGYSEAQRLLAWLYV